MLEHIGILIQRGQLLFVTFVCNKFKSGIEQKVLALVPKVGSI